MTTRILTMLIAALLSGAALAGGLSPESVLADALIETLVQRQWPALPDRWVNGRYEVSHRSGELAFGCHLDVRGRTSFLEAGGSRWEFRDGSPADHIDATDLRRALRALRDQSIAIRRVTLSVADQTSLTRAKRLLVELDLAERSLIGCNPDEPPFATFELTPTEEE